MITFRRGIDMSSAMKLHTVETVDMSGRAFNLTEYELKNKTPYCGIQLFREASQAQAEVNDDIAHGADEDEIGVTTVFVHPDGKIIDGFGEDIAPFISRQSGRSEADLKGFLANFYKNEQMERRNESSLSPN